MNKLPRLAPTVAAAHDHLQAAHPGARILSPPGLIVEPSGMVPTAIRRLLSAGEAQHPDALDTVVVVDEMLSEQQEPFAYQVRVCILHALP